MIFSYWNMNCILRYVLHYWPCMIVGFFCLAYLSRPVWHSQHIFVSHKTVETVILHSLYFHFDGSEGIVYQKWKLFIYLRSCQTILQKNAKEVILKNVGAQTTLASIGYCMNTKLRHILIYLLLLSTEERFMSMFWMTCGWIDFLLLLRFLCLWCIIS